MRIAIYLLAICLFAVVPAFSDPLETDASISVFSKYIWRGFNLCDNTVIQPSLTVSGEKLALNIWSSFDSGDDNRCAELDYTLSHPFKLGTTEAEASYAYYTFPNVEEGSDTSQEVLLNLSWPTKIPLSFISSYDFDEGDGLYFELGTEIPISAKTGEGALALALGYNSHQWREDTGFSHALVTYTHTFEVGKATISPMLGYSAALADDFDNEFFWGVTGEMGF